MQLPPGVAHDRRAMRQIRMAHGLSLRPVANVVLADHAVGPGHADKGTEINEQALQPKRAIEGAMDEAAVHAKRMAEADGYCRGDDEYRQSTPGEEEWACDRRGERHARDPQRFGRFPINAAGD